MAKKLPMKNTEKKSLLQHFKKPWVSISAALIVVLFAFGISWVKTYVQSDVAQNGITKSFLWYPAMWISPATVVSKNAVAGDLAALRSFYENQDFSSAGLRVDFSTPDGMKRLKVREKELLNVFVEQDIMKRVVEDAGMRVTDKEISENVERKLREFGSETSVKEDLERLYGWSLEDFRERVVGPAMYREKAREIFDSRDESEADKAARSKIESALAALEGGASFAETAKEYSEGMTAEDGGRFGWLSLGEIVEPEVAKAILSIGEAGRSESIESDLGYHIVRVHDTKKDSSGMLYDISQIFVAKTTFAQFLENRLRDVSVRVFLKGYEWDGESGRIIFSDPGMREFEASLSAISEE